MSTASLKAVGDAADQSFSASPPGATEPCPLAAKRAAATRTTWIAIELLDDLGNEVPDEPYKLVLPDGSERTGKLDGHGRARVEGIPPGKCRVTFPEREPLWWRSTKEAFTAPPAPAAQTPGPAGAPPPPAPEPAR
jgi:hypothetical protein